MVDRAAIGAGHCFSNLGSAGLGWVCPGLAGHFVCARLRVVVALRHPVGGALLPGDHDGGHPFCWDNGDPGGVGGPGQERIGLWLGRTRGRLDLPGRLFAQLSFDLGLGEIAASGDGVGLANGAAVVWQATTGRGQSNHAPLL